LTIASAPLVGTGCSLYSPVRASGKAKYFLFWDLTEILLIQSDFPGGQHTGALPSGSGAQ
jgi:hypothetical protein